MKISLSVLELFAKEPVTDNLINNNANIPVLRFDPKNLIAVFKIDGAFKNPRYPLKVLPHACEIRQCLDICAKNE
ncbi:MAG TPA: hypothetical protein VIS48_06535 [Candidatus Kryptonia bacterium]